jgi:hypothetical protein
MAKQRDKPGEEDEISLALMLKEKEGETGGVQSSEGGAAPATVGGNGGVVDNPVDGLSTADAGDEDTGAIADASIDEVAAVERETAEDETDSSKDGRVLSTTGSNIAGNAFDTASRSHNLQGYEHVGSREIDRTAERDVTTETVATTIADDSIKEEAAADHDSARAEIEDPWAVIRTESEEAGLNWEYWSHGRDLSGPAPAGDPTTTREDRDVSRPGQFRPPYFKPPRKENRDVSRLPHFRAPKREDRDESRRPLFAPPNRKGNQNESRPMVFAPPKMEDRDESRLLSFGRPNAWKRKQGMSLRDSETPDTGKEFWTGTNAGQAEDPGGAVQGCDSADPLMEMAQELAGGREAMQGMRREMASFLMGMSMRGALPPRQPPQAPGQGEGTSRPADRMPNIPTARSMTQERSGQGTDMSRLHIPDYPTARSLMQERSGGRARYEQAPARADNAPGSGLFRPPNRGRTTGGTFGPPRGGGVVKNSGRVDDKSGNNAPAPGPLESRMDAGGGRSPRHRGGRRSRRRRRGKKENDHEDEEGSRHEGDKDPQQGKKGE